MATVTASQLAAGTKTLHTGVQFASAALTQAATLTASSIILLSQVQSGVLLLDFWLRIHTGGASQTVKLGTSASPSGIMQIASLSQTYSISTQVTVPTMYGVFNQGYLRAPGGTTGGTAGDYMPVRISLSDDVQPATVWIQATLGVAISASMYLTWMLFYTYDSMAGHTTIR